MKYLSRYWLFIFLMLIGIFGWQMSQKHSDPISVGRLGQSIPLFLATDLDEKKVYHTQDLKGQWTLVNIWATWRGPCQKEHPVLMQIASQYQIPIYGINFKDDVDNAKAWLEKYGNPYTAVWRDLDGRLSFDWGVYGVPGDDSCRS